MTQPAQPTVDTATQLAQTAAKNLHNVPAKFRTADGGVNIEALAEAYRQLEQKQSQGKPAAPAPAPAQPTADADSDTFDDVLNEETPTPEDAGDAASTFDEALNPKQPEAPVLGTLLQKANEELQARGSLTAETGKKLLDAGVPKAMLDTYANAFRAQQKQNFQAAATLVGGQESLNKILSWVNSKSTPEQKQRILAGLRGPASEQVLLGLQSQYQQATKSDGPATDTSKGITGMTDMSKIIPFADANEMQAAMNDPKYQTDPEYRGLIAARMAVTRGKSPKDAMRLISGARR